MKRNQCIIPYSKGAWAGWAIRGEGANRVKIFSTQIDAIVYGKQVAKKNHVTLYIYSRDGILRDSFSYE